MNKIDNFSLSINKNNFEEFVSYLKNINNSESLSNIKSYRRRLLNIDEKDMFFLFDFLIFRGYCKTTNKSISIVKIKNTEELFKEFKNYYIDLILFDKELKKEIFDLSKFEIINDDIYFDINSININYRQIFSSLQKLDLIKSNSGNKKIVCDFKLAQILMDRPLKKISQKDFDNLQKNKKIKGEKAELFVMNFEKNKLKELNLQPNQVSIDNINLGYDIESYDLEGNKIYIEVKGINKSKHVYWTENEVKKSKILKNSYFLYCVAFKNTNPTKIEFFIQNPYKEIINDNHFKYNIQNTKLFDVDLNI